MSLQLPKQRSGEEIMRALRSLKPFWRERFRQFLAEVSADNGREGADGEFVRALQDPGLCWLIRRLLAAVPETWKEEGG